MRLVDILQSLVFNSNLQIDQEDIIDAIGFLIEDDVLKTKSGICKVSKMVEENMNDRNISKNSKLGSNKV